MRSGSGQWSASAATGAVVTAMLLLAGCVGDAVRPAAGGAARKPAAAGVDRSALSLLDLLTVGSPAPGGGEGVVLVDLRAVRQRLGVSGAARPYVTSTDRVVRRYAEMVRHAMPFLGLVELPTFNSLDFRRITAAAANTPAADELTVFATEQPVREIESELIGDGYVRDGELLRMDADPYLSAVARFVGFGPGVVAVGERPELVRAAVEGRAAGVRAPLRELITNLGGLATKVVGAGDVCPYVFAVADAVDQGRGRLAVVTDSPRADWFVATRPVYRRAGLTFDQPTIEGDRLSVDFTYPTGELTAPRPMNLLDQHFTAEFYRCR